LSLSLYQYLARPAMFLTPPETAHEIAKWIFRRSLAWRLVRRHFCVEDEQLHVTVGRLALPNPIGLAAGFDKDCEMSEALFCAGFGYLTLGTVTLNPREGNPKPRIWRYPGKSIINSMGLPNQGAKQIAKNLSKHRTKRGPIVVSISGLSVEEFVECYRQIQPLADGIELNISTPNTVGVRIFQQPPILKQLLGLITEARTPGKPVWVKLPPYFTEKERENVLDLVELCVAYSMDGITAINTKMVEEPRASIGTGGLSGPLIFEDMLRIVADIYNHTGGKIPINACGGISSAQDAWRALAAGGSSIQIYTSFIYHGPAIVSRINRELLEMLKRSGMKALQELAGSAVR
jgi:dihydroorotate dehydrogenase